MTHTNVMLDLETTGVKPGSKVLSIGAVTFSPQGLGAEFYVAITRASQDQYGLKEDAATMVWWSRQSEDAKKVLTDPAAVPLAVALNSFTAWLDNNAAPSGFREVWGNGAAFDNVLLPAAYNAVGLQAPWQFWNDRCYRTIKALSPIVAEKLVGTAHNALDDARWQARHCVLALNEWKGLKW